jgi:hypothetical protein
MTRRLRCRLGMHRWVWFVNDGERYLACKDCRKYSKHNTFPPPFTVWSYRDR